MRKRSGKRSAGPEVGEGWLRLLTYSGDLWHATPPEAADALRYMVSRWQVQEKGGIPANLCLTSTLSGEGVTFISRALADIVANDLQQSVCLVDLNWCSPSQPPTSGPGPGLSDVMRGEATLDEAVVPTTNPTLWVLPAGSTEPSERPVMMQSTALHYYVDELEARFDHVILDLPSLRSCGEALALTALGDSCVLVVRSGTTTVDQVRSALDDLHYVPALGVVLNGATTAVPRALARRVVG